MASAILTEYIQNVVDNVVHHNETFDDSKKKWLRRYSELEHLDEEEIDVIINSIDGFIVALKELTTKESRYIEIMARKLGKDSRLSESKIDEYIEAAYKAKEEDMAQMQAEIQSNIAATENQNQLRQTEIDQLAKLKSDIVQLQDIKANIILLAEKEAFKHIKPQWDQEQEALSASMKRCESIKNQISQMQSATADWQDKTKILYEKADSTIEQRKKLIHHILLIALGVFYSLTEFLLFFREIKANWVACVPFVLYAVFIFHRLGIVQDLNFKNHPEFLFSFIPLVVFNFEVNLIEDAFSVKWVPMFFILLFTLLFFLGAERLIKNNSGDKEESTHHIILVTVALGVSLFEFIKFGDDGFKVFNHYFDWGWAFVPFCLNMFFVIHRLTCDFDIIKVCDIIDGYDGRKWNQNGIFLEYLYSLLFLIIINTFAFCTCDGWILLMIPVYIVLRATDVAIYMRINCKMDGHMNPFLQVLILVGIFIVVGLAIWLLIEFTMEVLGFIFVSAICLGVIYDSSHRK